MNNNDAMIREKLALTDEALLAELGKQAGTGAFLKNPISEGLRLLAKIREQVRDSVCSTSVVQQLYEEQADAAQLVAAILDIVTGAIVVRGLTVSPFTVAVLLIRTGVGEMCREMWAGDEKNG